MKNKYCVKQRVRHCILCRTFTTAAAAAAVAAAAAAAAAVSGLGQPSARHKTLRPKTKSPIGELFGCTNLSGLTLSIAAFRCVSNLLSLATRTAQLTRFIIIFLNLFLVKCNLWTDTFMNSFNATSCNLTLTAHFLKTVFLLRETEFFFNTYLRVLYCAEEIRGRGFRMQYLCMYRHKQVIFSWCVLSGSGLHWLDITV